MNIKEIEKLSLKEAKDMAEEEMEIKEHTCLFIDLGGNFGYSCLVYRNGRHIRYANDYELHHGSIMREQGKAALREYYIKEMQSRLFTDAELMEGAKSYKEYRNKVYFLRNYWNMQYDYLSTYDLMFLEKRQEYPYYSDISLCYFREENIVRRQKMLYSWLKPELPRLAFEPHTFREMVGYELANHEAGITGSCREALWVLGLDYQTLEDWQKMIVRQELHKLEDAV